MLLLFVSKLYAYKICLNPARTKSTKTPTADIYYYSYYFWQYKTILSVFSLRLDVLPQMLHSCFPLPLLFYAGFDAVGVCVEAFACDVEAGWTRDYSTLSVHYRRRCDELWIREQWLCFDSLKLSDIVSKRLQKKWRLMTQPKMHVVNGTIRFFSLDHIYFRGHILLRYIMCGFHHYGKVPPSV